MREWVREEGSEGVMSGVREWAREEGSEGVMSEWVSGRGKKEVRE